MQSKNDKPKTYANHIHKSGAAIDLHSNCLMVNKSEDMKQLHHLFGTNECFLEPHYQNQNDIKCMWQDLQCMMTAIMNALNIPPELWLLLMRYIIYIHNHTANKSATGIPPLTAATNYITNISSILSSHFWQLVTFKHYGNSFPKHSAQCLGQFVEFAESIGDKLTFLLVDCETEMVIPCKNICSATNKNIPALHALFTANFSLPNGANHTLENLTKRLPFQLYNSGTKEIHAPDNINKLNFTNPEDKPTRL